MERETRVKAQISRGRGSVEEMKSTHDYII
jgi:hypothetical protein